VVSKPSLITAIHTVFVAYRYSFLHTYSFEQVCVEGPKEKLDSTVVSQPAIYVTSLAAVEKLRCSDGGQAALDAINVAAGLSLGEYTALAFAGAIT